MKARSVAREGLMRMAPFSVVRSDEGGGAAADDGRTLEGHAAVFGAQTVINSWEGRFTEEIAPGAFRKTFRERTPVMQFDHGRHPMLGSIPLGRFIDGTPTEDDTGAFVRARLADNWLVQPVRDAIADEAVTGMSFRFSVVKEEWRDEEGKLIRDEEELLRLLWADSDFPVRTLREIKVPELGPVVFPAYEATDVSVRSGTGMNLDLVQLLSTPNGQKTLSRAMFQVERATLGHSTSTAEPEQSSTRTQEPEEPQAGPALPEQHTDTGPEPDVAVALAERMRSRLDSLRGDKA